MAIDCTITVHFEMEDEEILYSFHIDTWIKTFKGQRHSTAIHITPTYHMVCNNVEDFKNKLWDQYSDYVKGKAVLPMNLQDVCSVQAESNTLENITSYFFFKKSNREYALSNSFKTKHLQNFSTPGDTGDAIVDMVIFAYGDALNSSENWSRFSKDCILPTQTDKARASNEEFIRNTNIMQQLQER